LPERKKWLFGCEAKGLMKNLIYTIVTKNYEPIFNLFLTSITRHTKFDICCITDSVCSSTHIYNCPNFDSKFDARFRIGEWESSKNYDNFLYLDVDILCQKDIGIIFEIIDSNKDCLHCVKELDCLNRAGFYHTFSGHIFDDSCPAYNSGTFGFNKKILPLFNELLIYINDNRHLAICDQPLFNEFFTKKNVLVSTLSPYVYLMNDNLYRNVNPINLEDVVFRHYLGDYGNVDIKIRKMEADLLKHEN
jgi:lipopolysaccharide biosynthesis glycosyltransferase